MGISSSPATSPSLREWPQPLLWALLVWHCVVWVLIPILSYQMLPLDAAELLGWSREWQLGYYKHPPLGPWLGESVYQLSGGQPNSLYLLAQLAVLLTLYYVWRCARLLLEPLPAILATLLLEVSYFHTVLTPNFNMNSLQLPIWAALSFHFLRALQGSERHWLAVGAWAAAAMLSKYSGALLLISMGALLLFDRDARLQWRNPWLWAGAALGLLLLSPHLLWLADNWRLPLNYLGRFAGQGSSGLSGHLIEPLRFALGALAGMLLCLLLALLLINRRGSRPGLDRLRLRMLMLCFGPLLLAMLYGAVTGSRLKSTWAFPFFSLLPICLLGLLPLALSQRRLRAFALLLAALMLTSGGLHVLYKTRSDRSKTAFDGASLALEVDRAWRQRSDRPLAIVAGDHILTAIVSTYAPSRPSMLIEGRFDYSPWLQPQDLEQRGAAVICEHDGFCPNALFDIDSTPVELTVDGRDFQLWLLLPKHQL